MASNTRPLKRPRTRESPSSGALASEGDTSTSSAVQSLEDLERDKDLWLDDGTVILVAWKIAFKVYKGLLSVHSPVFSDMFASAAHADETYDESPIVRVTDSPEDLKWLLIQLIPKTRLPMESVHPSEHWELPVLVRLAHKYQIDVIERLAIDRLKHVFTNDFEACNHPDPLRASYRAYNAVEILQLARLTNNLSMLPVAFYTCIQNVDIIIDGVKCEDGSLIFMDKADANAGMFRTAWSKRSRDCHTETLSNPGHFEDISWHRSVAAKLVGTRLSSATKWPVVNYGRNFLEFSIYKTRSRAFGRDTEDLFFLCVPTTSSSKDPVDVLPRRSTRSSIPSAMTFPFHNGIACSVVTSVVYSDLKFTASPLDELTRDEDIWLEDGSVVLVAKKTAFKVYKGCLATHSPVFSNMFSSSTHADETLEDSHESTYPELSALARLGHKYQIDPLQRLAIAHLKSVFTNDVEWETRLGSRSPTQVLPTSGYLSYNPINIIEIARLADTPSLLPLAAFCLCVQNEAVIIDGQAQEDGTHLVLGKADAKRCISGIHDLYRTTEWAAQQTIYLVASQPDCVTPDACRAALHAMLAQMIKRFRQDERRELWKRLPQIFGLQDELKGHWLGY
ncbi:hypothetical protein GSI_14892 [Ganoderma sinense ZZ0214-1]|uniref:BTB domain-containing protein n=1 Tax=Ganoderma sinense ZZ0214-1 TaxID=1077348 RepID=A0A2G8RPZ3_9APHY|nr:hypothetical protein GSI_14892 [Ganoderma sinense ZZ0214-1]